MKMLLAAVMAAGCGVQGLQSVHGQRVYVEMPALAAPAQAALTMWNQATGVDLAITDDPRAADITVANATDCGAGHLGYDDEGTTQATVCLAQFPDGAADQWMVPTLAHELGHVMGLHHIAVTTPALMNHDLGPQAITQADIDQFRARWGTP